MLTLGGVVVLPAAESPPPPPPPPQDVIMKVNAIIDVTLFSIFFIHTYINWIGSYPSKIILINDSDNGYFLFLIPSILETLCPYLLIMLCMLEGIKSFPLSVFIPQELNFCAIFL